MKTPTAQPLSLPVRLTRSLRTPLWKKTVSSILLAQFALWSVQVKGATYDWDPSITGGVTLGGAGSWNTVNTHWWNGSSNIAWPILTDTARFGGASGGLVTLGSAITAGGLTFNTTGYNIAGGGNSLTLTPASGFNSPIIAVNNNGLGTNQATISSSLTGTSGFSKTGNGTLRLSADNSSTLSGDIAIKSGNVVITNANQLGSTTGTAISVTGVAGTGNPGFSGGALILQGSASGAGSNSTGTVILNREVTIGGRGPGASNSTGALVSIGYNTLAGGVTLASGVGESRAWASHGTTTISGPVNLGTGGSQIFLGSGNWNVAGQLSGVDTAGDRLIKMGSSVGSTMWLQNANNNFSSPIRIDSGTVRVAVSSALGINTGTGQVDLNNGTLEVRTDAASGFAGRTVRLRNNVTGTIFVDRDLSGPLSLGSGSLQNQTVTFGGLIRDSGANTANFNYAGRNGYSLSFTSALPAAADHRQWTINNNTNGTLTYTGDTWNTTGTTANTYTAQGGAETIITGRILATGTAAERHSFTKAGSGMLTLTAAAGSLSTFTNNTNVNDGTLAIRSIDVLNPTSASAGRVVFGGGALSFLGASATGAGETWTNKFLDMNNANSYLLANQSGSAPTALVLPNNFGVTNTAAKTLHLGGSAPSSVVNQVTGLITNGVNLTNINKFGSGTWEIAAPTSYGTASAAFAITAIGATASSIVTTTNTAGLVVGQPVSGTGIPVGATIAQILSPTQFILSAGATNTGTTVNIGVASGVTGALAVSANTANVLTVASTANLVPGQAITGPGMSAAAGWFVSQITSGTTITVANATGAAALANTAAVGSQTIAASPNFGGNLTIANGTFRVNAASASSDIINSTSNLIFNTDSVTLMGNAGGTFNYVGFAGGTSTEVLGRLIPTAGHGVVSITNGTGNDTLTFLDIGTRGPGATLNYQPGTGTINFSGTAPAGSNGIQSGYATFNGVDWVTSGATASQFTGYTAGSGALTLAATTNFSIAGAANTAGAGSINSLKLTGGAALTLGGQLSFTTNPGGVLFDNSGGTGSITGSILGTAAQELVVTTNGSSPAVAPAAPGAALTTGNALTIGSTISSGAGSLTKAGNGTLILTGANAYTGNTTINGGAIQMSGATAALGGLGTAGNQTAIRQGAILDVNGAGALTALVTGGTTYPQISIGALTGTGIITNSNAAQSTVSLGGTATTGTTTFGGTLQNGTGILNVVINGTAARSQAILGAQPYTGITVINTGNLAVTNLADGGTASGLGASSNAASNLIFNGGTLTYTGAGAAGATSGGGIYQTTQTPSVSTDRQFSLAGNATIQSSGTYGNEAASAGTGANNASVIWSNTADLSFLNAGARTLTLGGSSVGDNEMRIRLRNNPNANEALSLTKADGGLWILNPLTSNNYTGTTTVSGGALRVASSVASIQGLSASSPLVLNGGVLETSGTFTRTLGAAVAGTGNVSLIGGASGFAASTTDRLVVTLGGGALTWGGATFAPTSLVLGSSTALGETEMTNDINLGTAARTVTTNQNGNTGTMVTAGILSGVISGGAGGNLTKNGSGVLTLGNANTYVGNTTIADGTLVLSSIGAAGATASSLGTNVSGGSLILNRLGGDLNAFIYVGQGETATRPWSLQGDLTNSNRTYRIESSGSGALEMGGTFTNTQTRDATTRTLVLELRGSNTDNNMITSRLIDSTNGTNPALLAITKNDGGTWILNPSLANTFSGGLTVSSGNLGLTANGVGAATAITVNNGSIFAYGGPLTTTAIVQGNNSTAVLSGQNSITIGGMTKTSGNNAWTISNNLEGGALLTVNGNFVNNEAGTTAATQTISIRGFGSTVWNGVIGENAAAGGKTAWNVAIANDASFTFAGATANTYTGTTTLGQGTLILNKTLGVAQIGTGSQFNFGGGVLRSDAGALTGANALSNNLFLTGNPATFTGTNNIELTGNLTNNNGNRLLINNLSTLTHSGSNFINLSQDATARTLTIAGSGATVINSVVQGLSTAPTQGGTLAYSGTGSLLLTRANTTTGSLTVNRGTATISGAAGSWAGTVNINSTGALTLDNSTASVNRLADAQTVVGNGGTLNFIGNTAGSSETAGQLNLTNTQSAITMNVTGGTNILTFASLATPNTGSSLDLSSISNLGAAGAGGNQVIFTAAPTLTNGINTRILINAGADFATYGATGVTAYTGYNAGNNLNTALATDTMNLTASAATTANRTVNAIKINGTGLSVSGAVSNRLTLTTGGVLNTGGNNSLDVNETAFGAAVGYFQVAPSTTLTVNGDLTSSAGFAKVLAGSLNFGAGARSFITSTHNLMGGTVTLNGGADTFFPNQAFNLPAGGTLNLNSGGQYVNALNSQSGLPNAGGVVNGAGALVVGSGGGTFGGVISSGTALARVGGGTLTFETAQSYTGPTLLMAGTTTLENDATILNTSSLDINFATLALSNNTGLQIQNNNRIADALAINLRGGTISVTASVDVAAAESFGAISALQGASTITATASSSAAIGSMDMTIASLTRSNGATVNFTGTNLGQQGNNSRIMITTPFAAVGSGLLGAWAIANSTDYAAYNTGLGIGVVGQGGFTGYDGSFATGNLTQIPATAATTTNLTSGTTNTGVLRLAGAFTNDITFSAGTNVLNLELGGLLRSNENFASSIGTVASRGILTSGTSELVVYNNSNTTGATAMTINSNIQGAGTALVKSGGGVLALTGVNTYGGGTTVAQGTLELRGTTTGDVVIPAGGLTLNNANVTQFVTAVSNPTGQGQIDPTNSVTLRGGSVVTMTGNNTLAGIGFDNNGGTATPTVTSGGILTLTNANPITVTSTNVASVATIAGNLSIPAGAQTINTPAIQVNGITVSNLTPTLAISANIISPGASIVKSGNGLLQLSGQNLFNGLTVSGGGVVVGASSSPAQGGAGLTSGPLGVGSVSMAAGTTLFSNTTAAIGNAVSFAGTPTFDTTDNTARTLTLNGAISGAGWTGTPTVEVSNPGLTVALLGNLPTFSSITKTGLGTLIFNSTNYSGDYDATALGNPLAISLLHDGTSPNIGNGAVETLALPGNVIFNTVGTGTITVNRGGGGLPFNLAANKIISAASINTVLTNGLTVANTNGYGLSVLDSGALVGTPTYTVNTATASNVTQGLYMSGALSGTGFIKAGPGTLVLDNAGNTFLGDITINQGVVSAPGNAQLGNASNLIRLAASVAGTATFRATGSYTLANPIQLTGTANTRAIEVTSGNTLTINNAFDLNGVAGAAAGLVKADQGTLALNVANSSWSGSLTINGGAVSTSLPAALGTGTLVVNETGAALQLNGGITVANPITIDVTANGRNNTGINTGGALQSVSGSNTFSSAITINATTATDNQSRNFGFGANNGATLNLGTINLNHPSGGTNRNVTGYFNTTGTGALNVTGVIDNTNASPGVNTFLFKLGDGTMTLSAVNAIPDTEVRVYRGNLTLNSAATFGTSAGAAAAQVQAWQNGSITFDNSVTNTANRLTNRVVQIGGGTLNFIPNSAGTSQVSTGALQISQGANVINLAAGGNQTVTFTSLTQNGGATLDMTGTFGTANNKLTFATAPTLTPAAGGLLARFTTNANEFATYNGTTGITTFTGYTLATNVLSAGATQTYRSTSATANSLTGNQTLNALTLQSGPLAGNIPNVGGLLGLNPTTLTLTSGAILANGTGAGTNSSLSVPVVAFGGAESIVHVASGQTLNVSSGFSGTGGLTKSLSGTLNLNQQQFVSGNTIVNGGTLNLQSGATNTLLFNNGLGINTGATVDLKNGVQFIAGLFSATAGGNTDLGGGTLTNSGAQATLVTNSNNSFNGQITGTIYLNKTGTNGLNLQAANTYTGNTFISGGTLTLQDDGSILNSSDITVNYGTLTLTNSGLRDNSNRVSDTAPITMTGGTINFGGRAQMNSSETLGAVTLLAGNNSIFADDGNVGVGTGTLTLASIVRSVGSTATLRFNNQGDFGLIGSRGRILMTSAPSLTNNLIGPWAIIDREYASYDATYGIGSLNQTGFAGYAGSGLNSSPLATDNVRFTTTGTTNLLANTTVGTLNFASQNAATILNLGGNTLTIQGGGLLFGQASDSIDFSITNGNITSGVINTPSDFYLTQANYGGTNRTVTIGAAITDNGTGAVRLIKSGGENNGVTTFSGLNTYTGGTVVNSGTLSLGATGTLGSGGITVNQATLTQVAGGVIPSQALTMNGSSTVTLVGNNTLSGLTIDNNGGSAPTLTPTGILTLTGGTTVTSSNAGAVATLGTGTIDLNGATAYSINVGATLVNSQDVAPWQAGLIINSTIQNGGITKTGAGVLQLGGANTFTSGVTISSGGLIIASDTNSLLLNDPVVTGPVGTGLLTMGANTTMIAGGAARTITNNVTFLGDTVFNGTNNLTLNGTTTLPAIWGATVTAPQMTVTIGDASPSLSSDVINKSGLGLLVVGNYAGTINASGGLLFASDGNTLSTAESINLTGNVNITGDTAITVNRSGGAPNARNKTLQKVDLVNGGSIMSVSNLSGYGLEFTGTTTLSGASHFAVGTATPSNVVQGLILSGVVSDAGGYDLVKSGPGTLVLGNAGNTFGGAAKTIDILGGILSVGSDGALGNSSNSITLNADAGAGVGFRSTGTFSTSRTFKLNQANNAFEVTSGNVLTLSSPLVLSATSNALFKNDNGVLELAASNSASNWSNTIAGITINAGAVRLSDSAAAGLATNKIIVNQSVGAALQLSGGITVASPLILNNVANAPTTGGLNSGGHLQSVSGVNTYSGNIATVFDAVIGADSGSTLNLTGGIDNTGNRQITFTGAGTVNLSSAINAAPFQINKYGSGTLNFTTAQATVMGNSTGAGITMNAGTTSFNGDGKLNVAASGGLNLNPGATLEINDNSASPTNNRLGTSAITFRGGNLNIIGSTTGNTSETLAAPSFARGYSVITVTADAGQQANLAFNAAANNPSAAQNGNPAASGASVLFRGSSLGSAAGAGIATIANSTGGFTFSGAGAAATKNKGILPWALVDTTTTGSGTSFATASTATGIIRPLAAGEYETANTLVAANNILLNAGATTTMNVAAGLSVNSLTIDASANLTIGTGQALTLASGGILVRSGSTSTISGGVINQINTASPFSIWTVGDLTVSSTLNGGNGQTNSNVGFVKAGAGTLTLAPAISLVTGFSGVGINTMSGQFVINGGTVKLGTGVKNAIQANNFLAMNNGTLDLNGNSQQVLTLFTDSFVANVGGIINNSAGTTANFVINQDNAARNFSGSIQGDIKLTRSGQNTLLLYSNQTYTGSTLINGGTTTLRDSAALGATTSVDINFATLSLDNNVGLNDMTNRLNDSAVITLRGATLTVQGRAQTASSEALGAVTVDSGFNVINPLVGGTGVNSIDVSLASLSRSVGSAATLIVQGTNLGTIGSNSRVTVGTLNGATTTNPTYARNGSGLTENLVGAWAINGNDFLTYIPGLGFAPLNQAGAAQYDLTNTFVGGASTDNVRLTATTSVPNGGSLVNAVSMSGSNIALNFATVTDTLNIVSGGLIGPNNNQSIGSALDSGRLTAGGLTPAATSDLYIFNRTNTLTINSRIIDNSNGSSSKVRAVLTASGGAITYVNPNASYTGGTVLNGGTLNLSHAAGSVVLPASTVPADGLIINNGTVTMNNSAGQIAAANLVTINGGGVLNYFGNNTQAGFVLNNIGGTGNPTVQSFSTVSTTGLGSTGVLTIGSSGVTATSSNVGTTSTLAGRIDFGASANTITVGTINANGVNDIAPLQAALLVHGIVGSTGGITKQGNGVLQLGAQSHFNGPFTVAAGGLKNGGTNVGSRFSLLTLNSGTRYDLNNATTTWGSLTGSGEIFSYTGTPTLNVGFDNTSSTFSGQFNRFNAAAPNAVNLVKIGTGVLSFDTAQNTTTGSTGSYTVNGGGITYTGAGRPFISLPSATAPTSAVTFNVNNGGTLLLDNSGSSINNRLGLNAAGTMNIQGGKLAINGNSSGNTSETLIALNVLTGGGRIELTPDAATSLGLTITTLNTANGSGSLVVGGIDGSAAGTVNKATLTITTPNLIGGQGTGANGSTTMGVRHDILGDSSVSGLGTGFLVRDTVGLTYRALASSELASAFALPLTTDVDFVTGGNQAAGALNVGLSGAATIGVNTVANTLTFSGTSSISSNLGTPFGVYGPGGNLLTTSLSNAAASLTLAGATATINTAFGSTTAGTTPFVHVIAGGTLNVNGAFAVNGTAGLAKADGGTLNLNNKAYYTGTTSVNNGTLNLNSGAANTIAVVPTAGTATVSRLDLNGTGATVDLKGQNQAVGQLVSVNPLPGFGGTITNSGALALFTNSSQAGSSTFGGQITGAIAFNRIGANTTTLTSASTYTGATTIRGGQLQLRDSGTISSTAGLTLNYGTLLWDNFGLNASGTPNPVRVQASNPVTMQGGSITINGAGTTDNTATFNTVTVTGGQNSINVAPYVNEGSTVKLTIGNLIRNASNRSGVNFNGFTQNNAGNGVSTLGGQGLSQNGNIIINQLNGSAFSASNLVNNLIGGWAVADGSTFATYVNGFGVSVMGQTTQGIVAPNFTGTDLSAALVATGNYSDGTSRTLTTGNKTANSIRFAGAGGAQTITPVSGTTYSIGVGVIANQNQSATLAAVDATNTLTGTGADLYFYVNQNTVVVNPAIIGSASLVSNGGGTLSLRPQFASNTYSGGTIVQGGTLNLQATSPFIAIPGALTITNAAVTMSTTANQIATSSAVTINGAGTLTLANYGTATSQTLDSITFNNEGGSGNPGLVYGTPTALSTIILSSATPLTSTNNSYATTPTISTSAAAFSALQFSNAAPVITVNAGLSETGLTIAVPITSSGGVISKTGNGALALSGASTFTNGFNLDAGSLIFGVSTTGTLPAVTNGPVGTGTLTIAGGTTVLSSNNFTVGNATTVNGDFTFGGVTSVNNLTLSGAMNLGATARTLTVTSPAVTATISGAITSTASGTALTKAGAGTLILSSATNNFAGAAVAVIGGILKNGVNNAVPASSPVTISAGAGYDLNGFDQTTDTLTGLGYVTNSANSAKTLTLGGALTNITSTLDTTLTDNILAQASSRLALTKVGTGTLSIPTANSYSGVTTVSGGMISITNAAALGTVTGGTVVASGASLELSNNVTVTGEALSIAGTGSATNGALRNLSGNNSFAGAVTLTGAASIQSDAGSLTLDVPTGNAITATNHNLTFTGAGNTTVADAIAIGSGSLTKTGSGSLTLGATNVYSGKTTIANGTISVGSIDALGTNAALDLGVATTSSGRLLYTGGVTTLTKDINALGNGTDTIQNAGSGLLTLSGTLTKAGTTLNLVGGASGILVTGTIVGLPASSDLVIGNGTTTLQNANTYNGPTLLNSDGTLNINHASAISTGAFTINGGTLDNTSGAAITLSTNNPLNINANFTFTGTNSLNLGTGAVTLDANRTVTVMANTLTIGGPIGGAFSLTGTGAGTLVLSGASTYTGTTTAVAGSTISVGGNGSLGDTSSGTVIDSGAALVLNNVQYTDAEPLNINGAGVGSGGAFITTGTSSFAGTITATTNATINATGTLSLTGGLVKNGTTLTLGGTGTYNISGAGISGSTANSDLVVDASTVNLDVASTYNGPTFIRNGGRINANVASALPTSTARTAIIMDDSGPGSSTLGLAVNQSVASLTGAATSQILLGASELTVGASGSGSSVFAGSIAGTGGSIVKDGTNTQTFSGANTYTGTTTVSGGTLLLNNTIGSGTGTGDVTVSNSGTIIGGNGAVAGNLTVNAGALIAPGSAAGTAGTLTIGGSTVVIAGNGVAETRVNFDYTNATGNVPGLTPVTWSSYSGSLLTGNGGQDNDLLNFTATTTSLTWNTGGKISLNQIGSAYSWIQGDVFNLLDWTALGDSGNGPGSIGGSFNSAIDFNLPTLSGGLAWDTSRFVTTGAIAVIPEPSRALLMLFGLMALFFRRRRQD